MATLIDVLVDNNGKVVILNNKPLCFILPDAYIKVDYIASTGTQYIDTGVIPTSDNLMYEWEGRDDDTSGSTSLFSSEYIVGANNLRDFAGVLYGKNTSRTCWIGRTTGMSIGYSSSDNKFHKWVLDISSDHKLYLTKDGVKSTAYTWTGSINRYNTIALFCNHTTNSFNQKASVAYKYFRIKDNGKIVFWGIPAKRKSDDVLGMYDLISKVFKINEGTGTFVTE